MSNKEQIIYDFWCAEMRENTRKREQLRQKRAERKKLSKPEYTLGIINKQGQYELVQAKPVGETMKRLPEVVAVMVFLFWLFAVMETNIGALK